MTDLIPRFLSDHEKEILGRDYTAIFAKMSSKKSKLVRLLQELRTLLAKALSTYIF